MAEGFEAYHVPQQSRRDKLRVVDASNLHGGCAGLLPLCDPSILTPNSLACAGGGGGAGHDYPHQPGPLSAAKPSAKESDGSNLMRYHPYNYTDLQSSSLIPIISQPIHDSFLYAQPQSLRDFGHRADPFDAETAPSKPEPLSLSLSNSHTSRRHRSGNLPLELNLQRYASPAVMFDGVGGGSSTSNDAAVALAGRASAPVGPFTGYATILRGSRFLRPAQQLLEEFCDLGRGVCTEKVASAAAAAAAFMEPPTAAERLSIEGISGDGDSSCGGERTLKKSRLVSMLDEVYKRYKQYYQQLQAVVASFESVAGIGNAAPYANLALKAMSKHFRCLKSAIMDQLLFTNDQEAQRFGSSSDKGIYIDHHQPVWRPQRGLPERAVTVLRAWLFEHFLHPYPTDTDKLMLAKQTGLSRSQVSNWFINARVRLWKPMVEEIHMLETRQDQNGTHGVEDAREPPSRNHHQSSLPSANSLGSENPPTAAGQRITHQDTQFRGPRHELAGLPLRSEEHIRLAYDGLLPSHPGGGSTGRGSSSSVSLTLGLHQNMGNIALSKPFSNTPSSQPFGLDRQDSSSDGFVMIGGFESQNGHFRRDAIGGQLLHDFVG